MSKKITALIPGAALALGIACIAKWLETLESSAGLHLIGASVIALFIGMAINAFFQPNKTTAPVFSTDVAPTPLQSKNFTFRPIRKRLSMLLRQGE